MDNIKFRAWDKKRKKMFKVKSINFDSKYVNCAPHLPMQHSQCLSFENIELLQFTTILDQKDNEIYNGHILKSKNKKAGKGELFCQIGHGFGFESSFWAGTVPDFEGMNTLSNYFINYGKWEIIGHIFDERWINVFNKVFTSTDKIFQKIYDDINFLNNFKNPELLEE
jgi:hypothetical protein